MGEKKTNNTKASGKTDRTIVHRGLRKKKSARPYQSTHKLTFRPALGADPTISGPPLLRDGRGWSGGGGGGGGGGVFFSPFLNGM